MSREHGFRRLTTGVSLLGLCAGLALTAHEVYVMWLFTGAEARRKECVRELTPLGTTIQNAPSDVFDRCESLLAGYPLPPVARAGFRILADGLPPHSALFDAVAERMTTFALVLGIGVTVVLVALPWAVFYFARWIVRGFAES